MSEFGITLVLAVSAIGGLWVAYYGIPVLYSGLSRRSLSKISACRRTLSVTFDDGPGASLTDDIVNMMARYGVKASFFPLGRNIEGREELLRRLAAEGHEICSHGYDHLNHWKVSPVRALRDIKRGWAAVDSALGASEGVYPFRPPEGKLTLVTLFYLWCKRSKIVYWSVDSGDTWTGGAPRDAQKVAAALAERGGAVALYHDFERRDPDGRRFVLESLENALKSAEKAGLECMTVSELAKAARRGCDSVSTEGRAA